ncbi:hypothetical protein AGMMS50249_3840 [candidate division SR1 bacterium]|nr:hypothetical protein AGMMS50249_3840 [candidate division SR1 bacterium]
MIKGFFVYNPSASQARHLHGQGGNYELGAVFSPLLGGDIQRTEGVVDHITKIKQVL